MTELSEFEEMYLKRLFEAHVDNPSDIVKTTQLAEMMDVSPASTTEMIQRLANRDLVTHIPYKGCRLTPDGFQQAAMIKRREGLLKILLTEVIGFEGDVHEAACKIEHAIDEELEMALDKMLGYPEKTPSGERIPIIERQLEPMRTGLLLPLSALPIGSTATIEMMVMRPTDVRTLEVTGVGVGAKINSTDDGITCNGTIVKMTKSLSLRILARTDEVL
ncbi:MAG: metal-dependent transcriptional regulator [Candidatus Thalassarchaeum sp.]|jgi:DtxR family Mn-dependent transcriptional regulator|nr:metal-dependent transcriptional regulator [Candidatus Thalassarchaeum sp.]HJM23172.1 metal-dependent transcriptional regulator [Candidatus Thalassarchaeum sp.]|tara:strand:- start:1029 stop:1685 length:657 start_codon:yes stop_codon:yes gene_type:complete